MALPGTYQWGYGFEIEPALGFRTVLERADDNGAGSPDAGTWEDIAVYTSQRQFFRVRVEMPNDGERYHFRIRSEADGYTDSSTLGTVDGLPGVLPNEVPD